MSLESEIKALTVAVTLLWETIAGQSAPVDAPAQPEAPMIPSAPPVSVMPPVPFPGTAAAPTFAAPAPAVPPMPPVAPAPAPGRPFNDVAGCTQWVISRYNALGTKGSEIQKVLGALGITNIQETKTEQFDTLFTQISALG